MKRIVVAHLLILFLASCASVEQPPVLSAGHIENPAAEPAEGSIPELVSATPTLPAPEPVIDEATHTVIVYDVPVSELLFSLARDSDLNLDIDPDVTGNISLNAVEQPLNLLLERIAEISGTTYQINNNVLRVRKDSPQLRSYAVDYLNIIRSSVGSVAVSTQISSTGQSAGDSEAGLGDTGNSSDTLVSNVTEHNFWATLENNIGKILNREQSGESGDDDSNPDIIINRESGIIAVRATERQHKQVRDFINRIQSSTQRQVLIEATIAEVTLSDSYQAGIDWNLINSDASSGVTVNQAITDVSLTAPPAFTLSVSDLSFNGNELQATLRALETFGDVSVMSSPKVMAMNNQTALLKVVDNLIYFTVEVNIDTSSTVVGGGNLTTFQTDINTVPVGFVMSVTPFIDSTGSVILNVRPTISRVIDFVRDPNPALADANVISQIPVIQVREVESILKINSGDIAVIGGLMQDEIERSNRGVPFLKRLPMVGAAFKYDDDQSKKTELVIFLQPTVIENASLNGDLSKFNQFLPDSGRR